MPFVTFERLKNLSPAAFKLYVFFLHLVQTHKKTGFTIPLVELGYDSGLQPPCWHPAFRQGKDSQLRRALKELIDSDLIEKQGQRGRAPNMYTVRLSHLHTNADPQWSPNNDELEKKPPKHTQQLTLQS